MERSHNVYRISGVKPNTLKERLDLYDSIVHSFDSYAERSISGQGIHIWVQNDIRLGGNLPVVSGSIAKIGLLVCTGNVLHQEGQLGGKPSPEQYG